MVELLPSPKFQLREAMLPSVSVDVSVKLAVRPLLLALKLAVGGRFATVPLWVPVRLTLEMSV